MKNVLTIILLLTILPLNIFSQDIGIGAKWVYNQAWFTTNYSNENMRELEIISDTIINGEDYFVLNDNCECSDKERLILKWEQNRVYRYFDNSKNVLYDFNLVKGDSLLVKFPVNDTFFSTLMIIDSINLFEGKIVQHVTISDYEYNYTDWGGVNIQNVGSAIWCITPQAPLCESGSFGLCEFISSEGDTMRYTEYYNCIISSIENLPDEEILIYPIPSDSYLTIENAQKLEFVKLFAIDGRELMFLNNSSRHTKLNLNLVNVDSGIIILTYYINGEYKSKLVLKK